MKANFHLALPCKDIEETKEFYTSKLGAKIGRNSNNWVDINLFENQITFEQSGDFNFMFKNYRFENNILPSFHFGVLIDFKTWDALFNKLLITDPTLEKVMFLKGNKGEHQSFFIKDPNGFDVEFKCFTNPSEVFEV